MSDGPVTVLVTGDPGLMAFAQSLLESAGIEFVVQGEQHHNVPLIGVAELQVPAEDAEEARALLADLEPGPDSLDSK
jgi:hypothetical protein